MTGAYTFMRFIPGPGQDHWDTPKGFWCAWEGGVRSGDVVTPQTFVMIRCPECGTLGTLPHRIDPQGGVHPSIVCTGPDQKPGTCPFHTMPNTLDGWCHGERPDTKAP